MYIYIWCLCIYIGACIIYLYIYIQMYVYKYIYIYMHIYIYMYIYVYTYRYMRNLLHNSRTSNLQVVAAAEVLLTSSLRVYLGSPMLSAGSFWRWVKRESASPNMGVMWFYIRDCRCGQPGFFCAPELTELVPQIQHVGLKIVGEREWGRTRVRGRGSRGVGGLV